MIRIRTSSISEQATRAHGRRSSVNRRDWHNLYVASIVALDADTGVYKWHYQFTPGDSWDYDGVQQLTLADLKIDKRNRKVVMQANKNGFFYVIDRTNGQTHLGIPYARLNWAMGVDPKTGRPLVHAGGALWRIARFGFPGKGRGA